MKRWEKSKFRDIIPHSEWSEGGETKAFIILNAKPQQKNLISDFLQLSPWGCEQVMDKSECR
jgi:hypothetical protein